MKSFILIIGKEMDAENNHLLVGPFMTDQKAIFAIQDYLAKHKGELEFEDFLSDETPFVRVTDEYGNVFEMWVKMAERSLDDALSYE